MDTGISSQPIDQLKRQEIISDIIRNAQILIPEDGVEQKIRVAETEGRQLRIKMGFDPTSPDLHLGHAVSMMQLKRFQQLGHLPVIIIGDFTGRIGDPSGRNKSRPTVEPSVLEENAKTYLDQLGKVIDTSRIEVHHNSEWHDKMTLANFIKILAQGSLAQTISREDFRKRLDDQSPIGLHEIVYPYIQGTDSVEICADIEIGGVDQLYAFQAARTLQQSSAQNPEALVLMPLLRGLDGANKMSKSLGNYIGLTDDPRDMFGKVMAIPDDLIEEYLRLASSFQTGEIDKKIAAIKQLKINPMEVKLELAKNITTLYHGNDAGADADNFFNRQFRDKKDDKEYQLITIENPSDTISLLVSTGVAKSKTEARRLIQQGGVRLDGQKITDVLHAVDSYNGLKLQVGKRRHYEIGTSSSTE